jgi:membrane-bound lytic murein transglycosylase B
MMMKDSAFLSITGLWMFVFALLFLLCSGSALADWTPLIDRLVADRFDETAIRNLFLRPEVQFDPAPMVIKLKTLIRTKDHKPSSLRKRTVHRGYLRPAVLNSAQAYYIENRTILGKIREKYCIPEEIIVSILMVETNLGRNTGTRRAFNVLAGMALCDDLDKVRGYLKKELALPDAESYAQRLCREKSDWAYRELKSLIKYAEVSGADPLSIPGSIYGAIGLCQFMPSNVFLYGVDTDEKGHIDLFSSHDALYSMGNYLRMNGWQCRMNQEGRYKVILTYNRSQIYANTVLAIADRLQGYLRIPKKHKGNTNREG